MPRAVAVTLACIVLAACGGGTDRLSASEYRSKASTRCDELKDASDELANARDPSATGATVTRFLRGAADGLRELVDGLDALEPPESLEPDADELVSLLGEYADGLDELGGSVRDGDTLQATFGRNMQLVQRLNGAASQATSLVTRLELAGCILS
jgi:ABC-type transporter Mla subunit MlaD